MATKIIEVKIKVDADTPVSLKSKENLLLKISNLPADDQQRILSICDNPKALQALKDKWLFLKTMFS
jgi:hypothetical protein